MPFLLALPAFIGEAVFAAPFVLGVVALLVLLLRSKGATRSIGLLLLALVALATFRFLSHLFSMSS